MLQPWNNNFSSGHFFPTVCTDIHTYRREQPVWIHGSFSFVQRPVPQDLISVAEVTLTPEIHCNCCEQWMVGERFMFMCQGRKRKQHLLWLKVEEIHGCTFSHLMLICLIWCVSFRDLLHDLEKCNADPVAIAECFVSKVIKIHLLHPSSSLSLVTGSTFAPLGFTGAYFCLITFMCFFTM